MMFHWIDVVVVVDVSEEIFLPVARLNSAARRNLNEHLKSTHHIGPQCHRDLPSWYPMFQSVSRMISSLNPASLQASRVLLKSIIVV